MNKNIQEIAGIYFFTFGITYFLIAIFAYNQVFVPFSSVLFNILDVPFCFIALLYGGASVLVSLEENQLSSQKLTLVIWGIFSILFLVIALVNYIFPDAV